MLGIGHLLSKAVVAVMAALVFGLFYIAPTSMTLLVPGEGQELYGLDASRYIAQFLWLFLVAYAGFGMFVLRGRHRSGRVVAIMLTPFAIAATALAPIGALLFLLVVTLMGTG